MAIASTPRPRTPTPGCFAAVSGHWHGNRRGNRWSVRQNHFRLESHTESLEDRGLNVGGQRGNISAPRAPVIHQHQRMLGVHAGIAATGAFPAALFDQPTCRQLGPMGHCRIPVDREPRVLGGQPIGVCRIHHRITEKTAGIAEFSRVGKLAFSNGADCTGDGERRGRRGSGRKGRLKIGVVECRPGIT